MDKQRNNLNSFEQIVYNDAMKFFDYLLQDELLGKRPITLGDRIADRFFQQAPKNQFTMFDLLMGELTEFINFDAIADAVIADYKLEQLHIRSQESRIKAELLLNIATTPLSDDEE